MNLEKAKLILIIAFTGLNLFLGYYLFWPDFGRLTRVAVTAEDLRSIELMLEDNNYMLEASFDRAYRSGDFITVSPSREMRQKIVYRLLQSGVQIEETSYSSYYYTVDITVISHSSGLIQVFFSDKPSILKDPLETEDHDLVSQVEEMLSAYGFMPDDAVFDYIHAADDDIIILHYFQHFSDRNAFSGQMKVILESDTLAAMELYWLQPIEREFEREVELISPAEALNNLVKELGKADNTRTIEHVEPGYFSGEYDAEKWDIPPVWRITLDGNEHFYINAFTGNLEKDSAIPEQLQ